MSTYWHINKVFINQSMSSRYTPILAYHNITSDNASISRSSTALNVSQFESQMRFLYDHGYFCLNLMDLFRPTKTEDLQQKKAFVLTFDDGYEDFYSQAYPILRRYGFIATIFLVTDLVGKESNWKDEKVAPMMTWEQIKALSAEGFSFGSHTCTHARLPALNKEHIQQELIKSKKCLKAGLGQEAIFLAYPYGESSPIIRELASQAGYQAAFGVITGEPGRFNLWRTEIINRNSMRSFIFKLTRWYSYYIKMRGWVRESTAIGRYLRRFKNRHNQVSSADHL
jgi:peptidoglycan/xylan/chitin deacetylase (PgdA/CDA1 family)